MSFTDDGAHKKDCAHKPSSPAFLPKGEGRKTTDRVRHSHYIEFGMMLARSLPLPVLTSSLDDSHLPVLYLRLRPALQSVFRDAEINGRKVRAVFLLILDSLGN